MNKYISILRGINVSGQKKITMADLKALYEQIGCHNVITYIQSGNVIFTSDLDDVSALIQQIEQAIFTQFSFDVPVQVFTVQTFNDALKQLPFNEVSAEQDGAQVMFTFLSGPCEPDTFAEVEKLADASERIHLINNVIYIHCPNGYGKTKLSNNMIEKKLNVSATSRNLKTVVKLCELALV